MNVHSVIGAIAIAIMSIAGTISADLASFSFSGTIAASSDTPTPNYIGSAILLSFSIDAPGIDSKPGDANKGTYEGQTSGTFVIGSGATSYTGTLQTNGPKQKLEITNKAGGDELNLDHSFKGSAMEFGGTGFAASKIHFHLKDNTALEFSSDALPISFSTPQWWTEIKNAKIEFSNGKGKKKSRTLDIDLSSTSVTPVPEPNSLAMIALFSVGYWGIMRRKKTISQF